MTLKTYVYQFKTPKKTQNQCKTSKLMVFSQLGRKRPQKRKDSHLVCISSTSTYATGVTKLGTL